MKVNVPEKLYVDVRDNLADSCLWGFIEKSTDEDIEYTRTNAFIEKVCEWLEENKDHPLIGCEDPCLSGYLTSSFIEDFRKAMKGE